MDELWHDRILMIIPSINGGDLLARMLPTLRFKPSNVIVLDQGSTDETATICADAGVELVQLEHPHTYTEACNIGARIARARGRKFLCVSNNDVAFRTNVLAELLTEMERDPGLGIVAPSQIVIDDTPDRQRLSYRVFWNLETVDFQHDMRAVDTGVARLESDFCELTCALVRMSAIDEIGFLDEEYGFYYEDADFGFRLRKAGYGCAYLPKSQINHFSGSTFNRGNWTRKAGYIAKNKHYFAKKHLGYGVHHKQDGAISGSERDVLNCNIHPYLRRYGLIDQTAPELIVSYPGAEFSGYLYTTLEVARLPERWINYDRKYRAIFTTSARMQDLFASLGIANSFHVPFGIEPDVFNPWGPARRLYDETIYLAIVDRRQDWLLTIILAAWRRFARPPRAARLILFGRGLNDCLGRAPDTIHRSGNLDVAHYEAERVDVHEILSPLAAEDLAQLYRAVDYTILGPTRTASTLPALETMACGVPCIFGGFALYPPAPGSHTPRLDRHTAAWAFDAAVRQEPVVDDLVARLEESHQLSAHDRAVLASEAAYAVRSRCTLRHTAMGFYRALIQLQPQNNAEIVKMLELSQVSMNQTIIRDGRAAGIIPMPMTGRLGGVVARRLKTAGQLAAEFGSVWQDQGFAAASKASAAELRYFAVHRSQPIWRLKSDAVKRAQVMAEWMIRPLVRRPAPTPRSALLIGYIDAQLGLGQSLRGLALAMSRSTARFSIYPFGVGVEGRRSAAYMPDRYDLVNAHAVNIVEVTPDELPTVFRHVSRQHFDRSYNVLRTYWELSKAPEIWRPRLATFSEIWAPNAFVAESFRTIFDRPIIVVPPCIHLPEAGSDGHSLFGLDEKRFYFLFSFDYFSFPQRKNPLAVVRAFKSAFPDLSTHVGLVIKSTGSVNHLSPMRDELCSAALYDDRIEVIEETLTRQEMLSLMSAADCYVSLHRSEGFGLGMAEAMALGKPVIGTSYSGNTDFLMEETGYPVPYTLRKVDPDEYIHTVGQVWADPDEAACASAMRRVFSDREEAAAKAKAGQRLVADRYGPLNVGCLVERRLKEIFDLTT
jgi:GT2 family glycosyltransferase